MHDTRLLQGSEGTNEISHTFKASAFVEGCLCLTETVLHLQPCFARRGVSQATGDVEANALRTAYISRISPQARRSDQLRTPVMNLLCDEPQGSV